ncbi:MAG: relaxase [Prevotella sp.]
MIGKAKSISHGINNLRYIMGESKNKKNKEKINLICCQHLPLGLDAMGVWESMQTNTAGYGKLKNTLIQIELSPAKEYTADFKFRDWEKLWMDFVEELDSQIIKNTKGKIISRQTNISGSKAIVCLHEDSRGGIVHIHGAVCRVDENGNVNNDHEIHIRAQRAAEVVARKRGWATAMDVRTKNAKQISAICEDVLKSMPTWSWKDYVARIERVNGVNLKVKARTDRLGYIKGYIIIDDDAKYKASELGRNLTYARLHSSWCQLHTADTNAENDERPVENSINPLAPVRQPLPIKKQESLIRTKQEKQLVKPKPIKSSYEELKSQPISQSDYSLCKTDRRMVDIDVNGIIHRRFLPKNVLQLFDDEFDYRTVENYEPLTNLACAYFAALLLPDASASAGGGGPTNNSGWRDKEEDDISFALRCAQMARRKLGLKKKSRGFHR